VIRTADISRVDLASHLSVADRIKDIIVRGGENDLVEPALENR